MPQDHGAEQGDVDGHLECSLALVMVAAETRSRVAAHHAAGTLRWFGVDDPSEMQRLQTDHAERMQEISNFQLGGPEKLTGAEDPRHAWMMVTSSVIRSWCRATLHESDDASDKIGAESNPQRTEVKHYVENLNAAPPEWKIDDVRSRAS